MSYINAKKDAKTVKMASKASDMKPFLDRINAEKDLEKAKLIAIEMSICFTAGGIEKFVESVNRVSTYDKLIMLCYNASLKGEGMGTKRF